MVMTARDLITMAMKELKVFASGTEPDASELHDGMIMLSAMLQSEQINNHLWRDETDTIDVPALVGEVTLPDDVRTVVAVRAQDVGNERSLILWDRDDYRALPNKTTTGRIISVAENRQRSTVSLLLWPLPAVDVTLIYDYQRKFITIADPAATVDVPEDWQEAVWTNLAVRMSGMFGSSAELTPELVSRAGKLLSALLDDDRPDSYFMGSDRYA